MKKHTLTLFFVLPNLFGCALLEKRAAIRITDASGRSGVCIKAEGRQSIEVQSLPYTYTAEEGETVSLKAFTTTETFATSNITTRITNDCESEVTYYAEIHNGYISITDDYTPVNDCKRKSD